MMSWLIELSPARNLLMSGVLPEELSLCECLDLSARKGFQIIWNALAQRCQIIGTRWITFRDYLGETVLDRLWNYFGETVRDILKDDFWRDFGRGFECGRYNTQVSFEQCCEVLYPNPKGSDPSTPTPKEATGLQRSTGLPKGPRLSRFPQTPPGPKGPLPPLAPQRSPSPSISSLLLLLPSPPPPPLLLLPPSSSSPPPLPFPPLFLILFFVHWDTERPPPPGPSPSKGLIFQSSFWISFVEMRELEYFSSVSLWFTLTQLHFLDFSKFILNFFRWNARVGMFQ
jgi:hypothetical protein